jgi:hypothetical protein
MVYLTALICYTLVCWGLSFTLAYAKVTLPIREHLDMIAFKETVEEGGRVVHIVAPRWCRWIAAGILAWMECVACNGFWIGFGASVIAWRIGCFMPLHLTPIQCVITAVASGFYTLGANVLLGRWTRLID